MHFRHQIQTVTGPALIAEPGAPAFKVIETKAIFTATNRARAVAMVSRNADI